MEFLNAINGLWNYFTWENETTDLCHAGKDITRAVNSRFPFLQLDAICSFIQNGNFADLSADLQTPLSLRKQYWLTKQSAELTCKIAEYPSILEKRFEQYAALGSPSNVFGVFIWLHSMVDIASTALELGILDLKHYDLLIAEKNALIQKGMDYFFRQDVKANKPSGIFHDGILESNTRFVLRHFSHNLKNIFRIVEEDQREFFLEVFEKWDFGKRRISVCVPISIGCRNRCCECSFGTLLPYHRALTASEIFNLIYTNAIINDDVTSLFFKPEELTIYYLGGGDPGDNVEEIEKVIEKTHQFYYGESSPPFVEWIRNNHHHSSMVRSPYPFRQIVSTIGHDNGSLDRLIDLARTIPELGVQVSVNAFDEQIRSYTIKHPERVMSIEKCIDTARRLYDVTSDTDHPRKAYLSIFLLQDVYDDLNKIMNDIKRLSIDKMRCHINLNVLRNTPDQFTYKVASMGRYKALYRLLRKEGYSASIYLSPDDGSTEEGCGGISTPLLQKMQLAQTARSYRRIPEITQ